MMIHRSSRRASNDGRIMALDHKNSQNVASCQERALVDRRRSRRLELIMAGCALAIVVVFALTHRQAADKPPIGAQVVSASAPSHP
jgi:predicted nucleic acid-binding Zn ribbon protein